ncbi:MAG: hypothetical protein CMO82_08130 [Winogradskyella sp.]|uniref:Uncharacterized protein n=1 Tax=Winogradskyella poriferorum TaxID=307627 RepID=A0ABU7WAP6_9FLAO|nr:hypothetical protein [Flavobacteriaceae bacterium]MBL86610.1 hypothetical protein [Winogradskyella sp.]|tara:strand:- start:14218 stop:14943 length:726 start_codon:yes stop_codon:yes gene_type:complete
MIRVFRKIRKKFFANKVSSYLVYAIGEIALVMIGILLALYVNNWNENRKLKSVINNTLSTISYDLEADTLSANTIIEFYKKNLEDSNRILNNEITPENYMDCLNCFNLVTVYQPFAIQTKGFEQLKRLTDETNTQKDSLISDITRLYSVYTPIIDKNNDRMETIVMKNFYELEKFPWFIDLATNKLSEEVIKYYTTSEDYKKRVASHRMLAVGNHLGATQKYKEDAIELINRIKQRLDKSQ